MPQKRRIMLTVSYDGTAYSGWALQESTPETIEGKLNEAIERLTGEKTLVIGASRTDAGVHAYGNVAVFDTESTIPGDRFRISGSHIHGKWERIFIPDTVTQRRPMNTGS